MRIASSVEISETRNSSVSTGNLWRGGGETEMLRYTLCNDESLESEKFEDAG